MRTAIKAEIVGHSKEYSGTIGGRNHLLALRRAHSHRLLAKNRFAMLDRSEDMRKVKRVGRSYQDRIHFRRGAERVRRLKDTQTEAVVFLDGLMGFLSISSPESRNGTELGSFEAWHETANRMKSKTKNSKTDHRFLVRRGTARSLPLSRQLPKSYFTVFSRSEA